MQLAQFLSQHRDDELPMTTASWRHSHVYQARNAQLQEILEPHFPGATLDAVTDVMKNSQYFCTRLQKYNRGNDFVERILCQTGK